MAVKSVDLLRDLRKTASSGIGVSIAEYSDEGSHSDNTIKRRFDRWWKGIVSAGLVPYKRRPLTPKQHDRYYEEVSDWSAVKALPVLFSMFTGISPPTIAKFSSEWMQEKRDPNILKVPAEDAGGEPWVVRLPETWVNPHTGERTSTDLPETIEWVLNNHNSISVKGRKEVLDRCYEVAREAGIESREEVSRRHLGEVPLIRPADLSYTHGANLVRQGVDSEIIERRLGVDGYRGRFHVDDVMLWVYVYDGYEHPEFSPPPVVLDPDTGEPRYS